MKDFRKRIIEKERVTHVAMVAPTTRLLAAVAEAWPDEDGLAESEAFVAPVVAIRAVVREFWMRLERGDKSDAREFSSADELRQDGFQFDRQQIDEDLLVVHPTNGDALTTLNDLRQEGFVVRIVPATWTASEDDKRLAPIISSVIADAAKFLTEQSVSGRIAS